MPILSTLQFLEQAVLEAELMQPGEYQRCHDRVHVMFDAVRNKLSPVSERRRSQEIVNDVFRKQQEACIAVSTTLAPQTKWEEPEAYMVLDQLGRHIPQPQLIDLFLRTITRVRAE